MRILVNTRDCNYASLDFTCFLTCDRRINIAMATQSFRPLVGSTGPVVKETLWHSCLGNARSSVPRVWPGHTRVSSLEGPALREGLAALDGWLFVRISRGAQCDDQC